MFLKLETNFDNKQRYHFCRLHLIVAKVDLKLEASFLKLVLGSLSRSTFRGVCVCSENSFTVGQGTKKKERTLLNMGETIRWLDLLFFWLLGGSVCMHAFLGYSFDLSVTD